MPVSVVGAPLLFLGHFQEIFMLSRFSRSMQEGRLRTMLGCGQRAQTTTTITRTRSIRIRWSSALEVGIIFR